MLPEADVVYALEPDELGLRMLPVLAAWHGMHPSQDLTLHDFLLAVRVNPGQYRPEDSSRVEVAIREAWFWLEGSGLLIPDPRYHVHTSARVLSRRAKQLAREPQRTLTARRLPKDGLQPTIREDVWALSPR
jgi:hypothetical protein